MVSVLASAFALVVIFVSVLACDIMGFFGSKKGLEVDGKTVLITGGSQGMGRAVGKLLAQKGANIVIVARNETKLAEAFKYISAAAKYPAKQRFNAISADVTKQAENDRIILETTAWNHGQPPDVVWQIAGSAHPDLFMKTSMEIQHGQMDLNYWAIAYLAQATMRAWLQPSSDKSTSGGEKPPRRFIMTSSIAALIGLAGYAPYSPAKAAMRSLADTLHSEFNLYNGSRRSKDPSIRSQAPDCDMNVHLIFPATIKSPGLINENLTKHAVTHVLEEGDPQQTEEEVAIASIRGLEKGDYLVTTTLIGQALRAGMMGASPRNNIVVDTLFSWVVAVVLLFVGPDMEGKVFEYGKKYGVKSVEKGKK